MIPYGVLRKRLFSTDLILKSINGRYAMMASMQNTHYVTKCDTIKKPEYQLSQQFSTSKQLMSSNTDHSALWKLEKYTSAGLLLMIPGMVVLDSKILEAITACTLAVHVLWGLLHVQSDYLRVNTVGPALTTVAIVLAHVLSLVTLLGLLNLTFNQDGIGTAMKIIWTL